VHGRKDSQPKSDGNLQTPCSIIVDFGSDQKYSAKSAEFSFPAATASRRRGNDLGTTIKYLRKTTSGAAGIGLGTAVKYPRRTTGAAAGNGLGTALNYLRGAAGNGRAKR
jgi:hypothetical protein